MLKIFKNKAKNKKKNTFIIGRKGTGMVRSYIKPLVSVAENKKTNKDL